MRKRLTASFGERRKPARLESPREQPTLAQTNPLGSIKGYSFFCGIKSLEPRCMVRKGFMEKGKNGERESRDFFDHEEGTKL